MKIIAFIGPEGSGKTTIASTVAKHFNVPFIDGDSFYSPDIRQRIENDSPENKDQLQIDLVYKPLLSEIQNILTTNTHCIITHSFKKKIFRDLFRVLPS